MSLITVEMTSQEARLFAGMQKIINQQAKFDKGWDKTRRKGKRAASGIGDAFKKAFDPRAFLGFIGVLSAGGALVSGLRLIKSELTAITELQGKAGAAQITLASAQAGLARNLVGLPLAESAKVFEQANRIARMSGVAERFVTDALAQAVSASAGNIPASVAAVRAATQVIADKPAELARFAGSLLDVAGVTGSEDAIANLGLVAQIGGKSRVVDPRQQARNIPTALVGAREFGASTAEAGSLFATLSNLIKDVEGAISGTAAISLARQAQEFVPGDQGFGEMLELLQTDRELANIFFEGPSPRQKKELAKRFFPGASSKERDELAANFFERASFEQKALGPIRSLILKPEGAGAREFRKGVGEIGGTPAELRVIGEGVIEKVRNVPLGVNAEVARILESGTSQLLTGDPQRGLGGIVRDRLRGLLEASGETGIAQTFDRLQFETRTRLGTRAVMQAITEQIDSRIAELTTPTESIVLPVPGPGEVGSGAEIPGHMPSVQDETTAGILRDIRDQLVNLNKATERRANTGVQETPPE